MLSYRRHLSLLRHLSTFPTSTATFTYEVILCLISCLRLMLLFLLCRSVDSAQPKKPRLQLPISAGFCAPPPKPRLHLSSCSTSSALSSSSSSRLKRFKEARYTDTFLKRTPFLHFLHLFKSSSTTQAQAAASSSQAAHCSLLHTASCSLHAV